jgi:hypothetical protein
MTRKQAVLQLSIILQAIAECPDGISSGHMYAALMENGITLNDYENLLNSAKAAHWIKVSRSHLVTITPEGKEIVNKIRQSKLL